MSSILSTVLITAPLAFMAGWIIAKAVFRYMGSDARESDYRKLLQQQQAAVTERDGQIALLHAEIDAAEARILKAKQKFGTWRERIKPIARQFRQQRVIINELRDELRGREAQQQAADPTPEKAAKKVAAASSKPQPAVDSTA